MTCKQLVAGIVLFSAVLFGQNPDRPLRVAIYNFDDSSVKENVRLEVGRDVNYGKIAADMLVSKLVSNRIEVINRDQMERLLAEQNFKFSDRFDSSQAVQFGKLLNVDAIVTGQIDSLFTETKQKQEGLLGMGRKKLVVSATVTVTSKLISTATAKILAAPSFTSTDSTELGSELQLPKNTRLPKLPGGSTPTEIGGNTGSVTTTKSAADPYIRKVLADAIEKVGRELVAVVPSIPPVELARAAAPTARTRERGSERVKASEPATTAASASAEYIPLDDEVGNVLKVDAETLTFSLIPNANVNVGDKLELQKVEFIADPRSGKMIPVGEKVGTVEVTEVRSAYSRGTFAGKDIQPKLRVIATKAATPQRARPRTPGTKPVNAGAGTGAAAGNGGNPAPAAKRSTEPAKSPVGAAAPAAKTIPTP